MDAVVLITLWQLAGVVLPIIGAIAVVGFLIFCAAGVALWVSGRGNTVQPDTDTEWLESL